MRGMRVQRVAPGALSGPPEPAPEPYEPRRGFPLRADPA